MILTLSFSMNTDRPLVKQNGIYAGDYLVEYRLQKNVIGVSVPDYAPKELNQFEKWGSREEGDSRGPGFNNDPIVSGYYKGEYTFIELDGQVCGTVTRDTSSHSETPDFGPISDLWHRPNYSEIEIKVEVEETHRDDPDAIIRIPGKKFSTYYSCKIKTT